MELALIPPKALLDDTNLTKVQLMLPQLLISDETIALDDYSSTYREHCLDPSQYVIMDNGAAEKEQMSNEDLIKILRAYEPDEFALPDVLGDSIATILTAKIFFYAHQTDLDNLNLRREELRLGFVAQGKTVHESVGTVVRMMTYNWSLQISTIYIPRLLIKETNNPNARFEVLAELWSRYGNRFEYHLFGAASTYPGEVTVASTYNELRSMDTSLPYQLSYARQEFSILDDDYPHPEIRRPKDYFNMSTEQFHYHARNVSTYLEACR